LQGERDFAAVAEARQQRSSPILYRFKTWLDDEQGSNRIPPKSPVRTAFTYTLSQWEALRRYTEQGIFVDGQQHLRAAVQDSGDRQEALSICEQRTGSSGSSVALFGDEHCESEWGGCIRACYGGLPYYRGGEAFGQYEAGEPVTSDELDRFLPEIWLRSNPSHRWELGEVRLKERESADRRKRRKRLNRLKRR